MWHILVLELLPRSTSWLKNMVGCKSSRPLPASGRMNCGKHSVGTELPCSGFCKKGARILGAASGRESIADCDGYTCLVQLALIVLFEKSVRAIKELNAEELIERGKYFSFPPIAFTSSLRRQPSARESGMTWLVKVCSTSKEKGCLGRKKAPLDP